MGKPVGENMNPENIRARRIARVATLALMVFTLWTFEHNVHAQVLSPEGQWKTISDKTGKATSIVQVWVEGGELHGKVTELIREPGQDPNPLCRECSGELKDQPVKGMLVLWGLRDEGDEWSGGYIMDPDNGKTYRCLVKVAENGRKLHVRG